MSIKLKIKNLFYRLAYFWPGGLANRAVILMYHSIGDNGVYFTVKTEEFARQMDYLAKNGYNVITLNDLVASLKTNQLLPKTVVLTFDDGYQDNLINAYPILKKYHFPATMFLPTGFIGQKLPNSAGEPLAVMGWEEIKQLNIEGLIDFEPHTVNHKKIYLDDLTGTQTEILNSKQEIEGKLAKTCRLFAYPSGKYNDAVIAILKVQGFIAAVAIGKGVSKSKDDLFRLKRNSIDSRINLNMFKTIIKRGRIN
jgi:peptidoglycan/xylan/chitin deacetylase (PgdA/CDA1 family)